MKHPNSSKAIVLAAVIGSFVATIITAGFFEVAGLVGSGSLPAWRVLESMGYMLLYVFPWAGPLGAMSGALVALHLLLLLQNGVSIDSKGFSGLRTGLAIGIIIPVIAFFLPLNTFYISPIIVFSAVLACPLIGFAAHRVFLHTGPGPHTGKRPAGKH